MADLDFSGRILGDFVLRERLAEGGFGAVYRCDQPMLGRQAVVKVLHHQLRKNDVAVLRFLREAQLASRLDHPYAAHIYASGADEDGLLWIAMELVHGVTLDDWLAEHGPLSLELLVPFFERIAEVVQAAHERGIIHRDLKPSNIMVIERAGQLLPKLLDFGVAKILDEASLPALPHWPEGTLGADDPESAGAATPVQRPARRGGRRGQRLTHGSMAIGSPRYMAPEQWVAPLAVDAPADLYALGVIAYEALTGRPPYVAETTEDYAELHRAAPVPEIGMPALDRLFARAMAKRAQDRFTSAIDLAAALRAALRSHPREQLRRAAQQWHDRARAPGLLWRGRELADLEVWTRRTRAALVTEPERSFVTESRRRRRWARWARQAAGAAVAVTIVGAALYRSALRAELAERVTAATVTEAELEQGRQALLHGETSEALPHLAEAYRRGARDPATAFMLARALEPRLAERGRMAAGSGRMWSASWSADGAQLVTADDRGARVWAAATSELLLDLPHPDTVYDATWSGEQLITACADGAVRIRSGAKLVRELRGTTPVRYGILTVSGDRVAAIDTLGAIARVWSMRTGALLAELPGDAAEFPAISFSPDGRYLAAGGGATVDIYETARWSRVQRVGGRRIAWGADSLAIGGADGSVEIWTPGTGVRQLRAAGDAVDAIAMAGRHLVTGHHDGSVQAWEVATGRPAIATDVTGKIAAVEIRGDRVLVAAANGRIVITDLALSAPLATFELPDGTIRAAHLSPDGSMLVAASINGTARVLSATAQHRRWIAAGAGCRELGCDPPTRGDLRVDIPAGGAAGGAADPVLWDVEQNQPIATLRGHVGRVFSARVTRSGVLTAGADGTVRLWDVTGQQLHVYRGKRYFGSADTDGVVVFGGDADGVLHVWSVDDERPLWMLQAHRGPIASVRTDGADVVTRALDGDMSRWRITPARDVIADCARMACGIVDE